MFHLKLKELFNNSVYTVCSDIDSFVYNSGRDFSRVRKLSPDKVISYLISQGASSTKCRDFAFKKKDASFTKSLCGKPQRTI